MAIKYKKKSGKRSRSYKKKRGGVKTSSTRRSAYGNYLPKRTNMFNNQFKKFA